MKTVAIDGRFRMPEQIETAVGRGVPPSRGYTASLTPMITSSAPRLSGSPLAAGATVPLTFIGVGMTAALVGTGWMVAAPTVLALPHLHPHVIALAHVWLLGALLTICFGAVYQLLPVLANTAFRGRTLAWMHLATHVAGVVTMIAAFIAGKMGFVALGGTAVSIGVGMFAVNVTRTLRAANRLDPILVAFGCATGWLILTVLAGVLLAANLHFGWWSMDVLALLRAHAHLGVAGFFVTLLQGAMFRLVPMFTLGTVQKLRGIGIALALSQLGLLVLTPALAFGARPATLVGAALLLMSFALSAFELRRVFGTRKKRILEPGIRGFFVGLALLCVAAAGGTILAAGSGDLRAALSYGVLAVLGGVLASVEGMLCKIVPFLVWMRVYGPRVGRQPTPVATTLGSVAFERGWVALHTVSVTLLAWGALTENHSLLIGGSLGFALAQLALLTSLATAVRHLWRPVTPPIVVRSFVKGIV